MLQSLHKPNRMSPPCLFCNYILHRVIPRRRRLPLISGSGEQRYPRRKIKGHVHTAPSVEEFAGCITPWANLEEKRIRKSVWRWKGLILFCWMRDIVAALWSWSLGSFTTGYRIYENVKLLVHMFVVCRKLCHQFICHNLWNRFACGTVVSTRIALTLSSQIIWKHQLVPPSAFGLSYSLM